jgi:hypothetical protein
MSTMLGSSKHYVPKNQDLMFLVHIFNFTVGIFFFIFGTYTMFTARESINGLVIALVGLICLWAAVSSNPRVTFVINLILGGLFLIGFTSRALSYDGIGPDLNLPIQFSNYIMYGGLFVLFLLSSIVWIAAVRRKKRFPN